jgi:ribosomal protein S27AE
MGRQVAPICARCGGTQWLPRLTGEWTEWICGDCGYAQTNEGEYARMQRDYRVAGSLFVVAILAFCIFLYFQLSPPPPTSFEGSSKAGGRAR